MPPRKPAAHPAEGQAKTPAEAHVKTPWTVAEAKARFSEVLERARREGPQFITRNGKQTAVIVGAEEWERRARRQGSLAEFLLSSPLRGADLDIDRLSDEPREP